MGSRLLGANGNVIVAHPGTQHSYETARAVQEAGLLQRYITGFYYKPNGLLGLAARLLPDTIRSRVERELYRRYKEGLDPDRVQTFPAAELLYVAVSRLRPFKGCTHDVTRWRNERFDSLVGRIIVQEQPAALICYNGCALQAFKKAQPLDTFCILDQSSTHIRTGLKLLHEEAELHPDFADSLPFIWEQGWLADRASREAIIADRVLVASECVKESLIENGVDPAHIIVIPYGVGIERFRPSARLGDSKFQLLFVGKINQLKGIKYLLEAVKQLELPGVELVLVGSVVGSGKGLAAYRDYFAHVPNVPYHEVHAYFQKGDVFVYPSLYEGSALAIYEALASGLPVITTPNSGSVVRDGVEGFIVPIRDVDTLKEKILLLYQNKELREEMGQNARKRAEQFTWAAYRQRLGSVLREILHMPTQETETVAHG